MTTWSQAAKTATPKKGPKGNCSRDQYKAELDLNALSKKGVDDTLWGAGCEKQDGTGMRAPSLYMGGEGGLKEESLCLTTLMGGPQNFVKALT